ncbi:MAG: flagellar motor protein MotB [Clostridia bacterium]|nr:flagellar motor protein MotB [Clostridia bacterium]
MARKKKVVQNPPGAPLWMTTYGDMITLVLCFFILLFAYSSTDTVKWKMVVSSLKGSIGVLDGGETLNQTDLLNQGTDPDSISDSILTAVDAAEAEKQDIQELQEIVQQLREELSEEISRGEIIVQLNERGVLVRLQDTLLFDSGRAVLRPEARTALNEVANTLRGIDRYYRIEGHTDDVPTDPRTYATNWELSAARATNVLRYLVENGGMDPFRMSGGVFGEYYPLVANIDRESRQKNRRVDIIVLRDDVSYTEERVVLN